MRSWCVSRAGSDRRTRRTWRVFPLAFVLGPMSQYVTGRSHPASSWPNASSPGRTVLINSRLERRDPNASREYIRAPGWHCVVNAPLNYQSQRGGDAHPKRRECLSRPLRLGRGGGSAAVNQCGADGFEHDVADTMKPPSGRWRAMVAGKRRRRRSRSPRQSPMLLRKLLCPSDCAGWYSSNTTQIDRLRGTRTEGDKCATLVIGTLHH